MGADGTVVVLVVVVVVVVAVLRLVAVLVGLATFGPCSFGQELAAVWRSWWLFWLAWLLLGLAALGRNWIVFGLLGVGWAGCWELTGAYGSLQGLTGAWPFYATRALKVTSATTHGVARKQHFGGLQGPKVARPPIALNYSLF